MPGLDDAGGPWATRFAPSLGLAGPDDPLFRDLPGGIEPGAQIKWAAANGFAGVQDNFLLRRSAEVQNLIRCELAEAGLQMGCFVHGVAEPGLARWGVKGTDVDARIDRDIAATIAGAQRSGARTVTLLSAVDPDQEIDAQENVMIERLARWAPTLEAAGVVLVLEAANPIDFPGMLPNRFGKAIHMVEAVGHPAVRLMLDIFHIQRADGNVIAHIAQAAALIGAVQIADSPLRSEPGTGELNWVNIIAAIRKHGYSGLIELEFIPSARGIDAERRFLQTLRTIDREIALCSLN